MEIIQQYIEYIKCKKKLSENTICSYYTDIKKYLDYLKCENIKLEEVAEYDIINFLVNLEKQNNSVATVSRVTSSVKSFHDYLFLNRISETNPANNIKKPKIKRESVEILTEEEIEALKTLIHCIKVTENITDEECKEMFESTVKVSRFN